MKLNVRTKMVVEIEVITDTDGTKINPGRIGTYAHKEMWQEQLEEVFKKNLSKYNRLGRLEITEFKKLN